MQLLSDGFTRSIRVKRTSDVTSKLNVSATLFACDIGERAYEWVEKGHGVFSYYLLEGLNGKAVNTKEEVTVTGRAEYTQEKVVAWAEEFRGKKQTQWLNQSGGARLVLVGFQLQALELERRKLESELNQIRQQLSQVNKSNDRFSEANTKQRAEEVRQRELQTIRDAESREQARRKQAEIERKRQQLEASRQRLQAQQVESMTLSQALAKANDNEAIIEPKNRSSIATIMITAINDRPVAISSAVTTKSGFCYLRHI